MTGAMTAKRNEREQRAHWALEGLSVGDAFGGMYFVEGAVDMVERRDLFPPMWDWTDDTAMGASVYADLRLHGAVDQDWLAADFARRYAPERGYGPFMNQQLSSIREGTPWREAARAPFGVQGTYGNGAAMRSAPLGAYFADDLEECVRQAALGAEVTHCHPEGVAGGVAVALAAALAYRFRIRDERPSRSEFLDAVITAESMPQSVVRENLKRARDLERVTWSA